MDILSPVFGLLSFLILKFRSMHEEAASYAGPCVTAEGDARYAPTGCMIESPQEVKLKHVLSEAEGEKTYDDSLY
jgi:hypothetical protein